MEILDYVNVATWVVAVASAAANLTPTNVDNQVVAAVGKLVNFLAFNWRNPNPQPPSFR